MNKSVLALVLVLGCVPLASCNQQRTANKEGVHEHERGGHGGGGLRRVCAADLDKYCAGQERGRARRDCLQTHLDQLSADCKAAVQERGGRRRRHDF
jgi:hypothetical protein